MSAIAGATVNDDDQRSSKDPLDPLKQLGLRICWVRDLGAPGVFVPDYRVMLLESALSRAEVYVYVQRWVAGRLPA